MISQTKQLVSRVPLLEEFAVTQKQCSVHIALPNVLLDPILYAPKMKLLLTQIVRASKGYVPKA